VRARPIRANRRRDCAGRRTYLTHRRRFGVLYRAPEIEDAGVGDVTPGIPHRPRSAVVADRDNGAKRWQPQLREALCRFAAIPAAPALAALALADPVLQQLLAYVALVRVDGVVRQVQWHGVRIRLTVELLGPRAMLLRLLDADLREDVVRAAATSSTPSPATVAVSTAASLAATAATSISVLHSLSCSCTAVGVLGLALSKGLPPTSTRPVASTARGTKGTRSKERYVLHHTAAVQHSQPHLPAGWLSVESGS